MDSTDTVPVRRSALFPGYSVTATAAYVDSPQYDGTDDQNRQAQDSALLSCRAYDTARASTPGKGVGKFRR